ncbi:unnamed protein product [Durusdinium trenchii]|uniref:ADP-ribosylglycohydrolase n=1 Tax=Durusdinium trenchii TaxID=1381693 RepID=A0ABP0NCQ3_9DINO
MALTLQLIQFLFLLGMPVGLGQSSPTLRGSNLTQAKAGNLTKSGWGSATISKGVLHDKIMGYWVGQLVGNFMGLPFEFQYNDQPMPLEPQTYYDLGSGRAAGLRVNADGRGRIPQRLNRLQGAYTDDDTDIEFVTLHALENHGLDLNYKQIAGYWKNYVHITVNGGDALWFANRVARENMNRGQLPPQTGSQSQNRYWWTIDPQLVNELWSAVYPGMIDKAVERAEWGARITSDSWGTHPTRFYAALYSGAFFSSDVDKLYEIGMSKVPGDSPFHQGLKDIRRWKNESPHDWKPTWYKIKNKYARYPSDCGGFPWNCGVSSMINGLMGAMSFLYGEGDFKKTVGVGIAAGFDCDNQAATLGGVIGVMHGANAIPHDLTHRIAGNNWNAPFNNKYVNERRQPLPRTMTNTEIVGKIMLLAERAIAQQGGQDSFCSGILEHFGTPATLEAYDFSPSHFRLALETGRDLARRLAKNGKEEPARKALQQARAMAGLSARDYGGGLATAGWEKRATQDVSLTTDDGFDEEVAQAAGITDEDTFAKQNKQDADYGEFVPAAIWGQLPKEQDPNKEFLDQRAKEGRAKAKELAEFAKLQQSQRKDAANKGGLASLVAERAAAKNTKRELPSFLKVGGAKGQTTEPEAKRPKTEEEIPKPADAAAEQKESGASGIGGLGGYESDSEED